MSKKVSVDLEKDVKYLDENTSMLHVFRQSLNFLLPLRLIKKFTNVNEIDSLLEIGVGSGFFLMECEKKLPHVELYGLEYDPRLLEAASKKVSKCILKNGNAEEFSFSKKFDVIVSFQVIEHLYNPGLMLNQVKNHLKPNGLFIVTTPNLNGLGAKLMGEKWGGYRDDHVNLKGADDWQHLIESHGFKSKFSGTSFFSGFPIFRKLPLGLINWALLLSFGALRWKLGEAYVGAYKSK